MHGSCLIIWEHLQPKEHQFTELFLLTRTPV